MTPANPLIMDDWTDYLRLIVTVQATFSVGLSVLVFILFAAKGRPLPAAISRWHALALGVSLVLLTLWGANEIAERWTAQAPITFRTPVCLVAFGLQDAALSSLLYRFAREDRRAWHSARPPGIS